MKLLSAVCLMLVLTDSLSWAQTRKPKTLDELAAYTGQDRQQMLLEGARAEGRIVWYTSLAGVYRDLVDSFKRKYPEISVEPYRGGSTDLGARLINEAQARRSVADALEGTPGLLMALRERGILKPYLSPELARYPDKAKTKADGARIYWVTRSRGVFGLRLQHAHDRAGGRAQKFSGSVEGRTQGQIGAHYGKLQ